MNFSNLAKHKGFRVTMPRSLIYNSLLKSPLTFEHLTAICLQHAVDLSTAYRVIDFFVRHEIVSVTGSGTHRIIQLTSTIHAAHVHHIRCLNCGSIKSFHDKVLENHVIQIAKSHGLKSIEGHLIEISGLCNKCSQLISSER